MRTPALLCATLAAFAAVGTIDYHAAVVTHTEYLERAMIADLDHLRPEERALLVACARADLAAGADACAAVQLVRLDGELAGIGPVHDAEGYRLADLALLDAGGH